MTRAASIRAWRAVRRVHLLPRRPGVAAASGRGARRGKDAFAEVVEEWTARIDALRAYSVTGVRPDSDFFLWKITQRYEDLGELGAALNATPLAGWLETPYSYLATTKASQYTQARRRAEGHPEGLAVPRRLPVREAAAVVRAPEEDRQRAMDEHIRVGREFPTIHNHTTYSFGIDDQEFMTAFECDEPADFMHLMLTLRESEASRYTERDTPIFVGQRWDPRRARPPRRRVGAVERNRHPRALLAGSRCAAASAASPLEQLLEKMVARPAQSRLRSTSLPNACNSRSSLLRLAT